MKTKQVPAIVMLTAGLIVCVISIAQHMEFGEFVTTLFLVLICFYILGCVAKVILDKNFAEETEETDEAEGTEEENEQDKEAEDTDKKKKKEENIESDGEEENKTA